MIEFDPINRISISGALKHPFFWSPDKQLRFLLEASDRLEKLAGDDLLLLRVESCAPSIIGIDWSKKLDSAVTENLLSFRGYRTHRLFDLIRAMRNKRNHFRELDPEVQKLLGFNSDEYINYFTSRFPPMLTYLYNAFTCVRHEYAFDNYFSSCDPDYFEQYYREWMKDNELKESELEYLPVGLDEDSPQKTLSSFRDSNANKPYYLFRRKTFKSLGSRHSDSDIVHPADGDCDPSTLQTLSKFRSPAMQKLHLKSLQRQSVNSCSSSSEEKLPQHPPGLTCSQENLALIDSMIIQELQQHHSSSFTDVSPATQSDDDKTVSGSKNTGVLFRIDSCESPLRDATETCEDVPDELKDNANVQPPTEPTEKPKKKTRRGKKAKKSSTNVISILPIDVSD